jgi:hypothetical protein
MRYNRIDRNGRGGMANPTGRQLDAAAGAAFAILMAVALALPGQPPRASDDAATIVAILTDRRTAFLVSGYVAGFAAMAYLWFLGSVRDYLGGRGAASLAGTAGAGGVFAITLLLLGMLMFNGTAFAAERLGDPALVRAFADTGNSAIETSKFGFAVFVLALSRCGAASGLLPRWLTRLGALSGLLMVGSAVALFVDRGILQFGGVVDIAGGIPALLWIAALSVVMVLDTRAGAAAAGPAAC